MTFRSIRHRIIFVYLVVLTLTFATFGTILYNSVKKRSFDDVNDLLLSKAQGIIDSIEASWEAEKTSLTSLPLIKKNISHFDNINFEKVVGRWLREKANDPLLLSIDLNVYDAQGKIITSTEKLQIEPVFPQEVLSPAQENRGYYADLVVNSSSGKSIKIRTLTLSFLEENQPAYFVQVIYPLTQILSFLGHLRLMLLIFLPSVLVLSFIISIVLTRITLNPIDEIIKTIHKITAENMKLRLTIPDTKDEVKKLADTFNEMLDRLEKSFVTQQVFIEDLTHELKTPLAILKGEIEVTLKKIRSTEDYEDVLRSSLEEINKLIKMCESMLLLARFEAKAVVLEKNPVELNSLIQRVVNDIDILAAQKNIRLVFEPAEPVTVIADEARLQQVFSNLLDNALKYTPPGGSVSVKIIKDNSQVKVSISDTGMGINEKDLPHIFERFYHGRSGSKEQVGFGLGLAIAKAIVEAHQGKIEAVSQPPKGSTFSVSFPHRA
jgi:heavy metal sensor kinase